MSFAKPILDSSDVKSGACPPVLVVCFWEFATSIIFHLPTVDVYILTLYVYMSTSVSIFAWDVSSSPRKAKSGESSVSAKVYYYKKWPSVLKGHSVSVIMQSFLIFPYEPLTLRMHPGLIPQLHSWPGFVAGRHRSLSVRRCDRRAAAAVWKEELV
jgi:hypothetical protein